MSGAPVTKLLDADGRGEVAVFGAVWIRGSVAQYVEHVNDIEHFERGGVFTITKRIGDPPRPTDFSQLNLPDQDITALKACRVGDCEVKLEEAALQRFQSQIDWKRASAASEAQTLFRRVIYQYVARYLQWGNAKLAVLRDGSRPTFVATELASMVDRLPPSLSAGPELKQYLLQYPSASLGGSTDFLYRQEANFGLKPTIRVNHLVIQQRPDVTLVASKLIYATHYFWTALELRVLMPDPARGHGFWFVMVNRCRSDGLTGLVGRVIGGAVRNEAVKSTTAALTATRTHLETTAQ